MVELYLIFFGAGLLLFGGIVGYSVLQKRRQESPTHEEYVDPLFAELEEQKSQQTELAAHENMSEAVAQSSEAEAKAQTKAQTSAKSAPAVDAGDPEVTVEKKELEKKAPSLAKPSSPSQPLPAAPDVREPTLTEEKAQQAVEKTAQGEKSPQSSPPVQPKPGQTRSDADGKSVKAKVDRDSSTVLTELVARIKNPEPIEQQGLLSLFRKHDFKFHRKVHIYGLNQLTEMWRDIEFELPAARFTELGVSIQLADREGAMSEKELHDFQQMVLEFTNEYDAPFEFSMDIDEALKQAAALDQIGRRYDSMAVLNVVAKSKAGFRMADIESCARDLMMSTDKNGIFMKTRGHKSNMSVLFRLACTDGSGQFGVSGSAAPVHDLVVYMNVPATEDPENVFQDMVKDANSLATWLEGKVVDRAGRVMTQRSYSVLMQQVSDIAFSMQQDGLIPGDAISKKLF